MKNSKHWFMTNNKRAALKKDPTKTVGIRKRWMAQFNKRYRTLAGRITKMLLKGDEGLIINVFQYTSDARSVAEFMGWLQLQIDDLLFTNDATPADIWQNKFIDQSYSRGVKLSKAQLRKTGITADMLQRVTPANILGTAAPNIGVGVGAEIVGPIHMESIQLLYTREYNALKGITDSMSRQISRVMVEGIEQGLGVRDVARNINDRVKKIGLTRSKLLARTETARAYNIGTANEFEQVASDAGVPTMFEWVTAGDDRVRDTHVDRNGNIYDRATALSLIGEPNCRCAIIPHIDPSLLEAA